MVEKKRKAPGRKPLPEDPRRRKQVSTFKKRYGREGYAAAGSRGGQNSPTKFNSETAAAAARKRWANRTDQAPSGKEKTEDESKLE